MPRQLIQPFNGRGVREQFNPRSFNLILCPGDFGQLLRVRILSSAQSKNRLLVVGAQFRFRLTQAFQLGLDDHQPRVERFDFLFYLSATSGQRFDLFFLIDALADAAIALQRGLGDGGT